MNVKKLFLVLIFGMSIPLLGMEQKPIKIDRYAELLEDANFSSIYTGTLFSVNNGKPLKVTSKSSGYSVTRNGKERSVNFEGPVPAFTFYGIPLRWQKCQIKNSIQLQNGTLPATSEGVSAHLTFNRDVSTTNAGYAVLGGIITTLAATVWYFDLWGNKK